MAGCGWGVRVAIWGCKCKWGVVGRNLGFEFGGVGGEGGGWVRLIVGFVCCMDTGMYICMI